MLNHPEHAAQMSATFSIIPNPPDYFYSLAFQYIYSRFVEPERIPNHCDGPTRYPDSGLIVKDTKLDGYRSAAPRNIARLAMRQVTDL